MSQVASSARLLQPKINPETKSPRTILVFVFKIRMVKSLPCHVSQDEFVSRLHIVRYMAFRISLENLFCHKIGKFGRFGGQSADRNGERGSPFANAEVVDLKQTIPVVDLNDFRRGSESDRARFIKRLGEAFVEYGFVAIENHGVDGRALANAYKSMRALFELSDAQKSKY